MLKDYKNREFAITLIDIFIFDAKIEYIDSRQLTFAENHFFASSAFKILINNLYKQIKIYRITRISNIFKKPFILFLLNLISKANDD